MRETKRAFGESIRRDISLSMLCLRGTVIHTLFLGHMKWCFVAFASLVKEWEDIQYTNLLDSRYQGGARQ